MSALALLALTGCELVGHLDPRSVDPINPGCALPTEGDGRIRLANLRPDPALVDFCVRSSGGTYGRPVIHGGGSACGVGYRYEDVSAPFAVPAGAIDVKMIAAGNPCAAPALAEIRQVAVDTTSVVTIANLAGPMGLAQLAAWPEEATSDASHVRLRLVNATVHSAPLYLGLAKDATVPTQLITRLLPDAVAFGATPKPNLGLAEQIDERGYLVLPAQQTELGVALDADTNALFALSIAARPATYSLFAIGDVADKSYPPRGLLCDESTPSTGLTLSCVETSLAALLDGGVASAGSAGFTGMDGGLSGPGLADDGGALLGFDAGVLVPGMTNKSDLDMMDAGAGMQDPATATLPGSPASGPTVNPGVELSAQYEINPVAPADIEIAPVLRITNVGSRQPIPLKSLTMRYYFTNEHFSECPQDCVIDDYYDNLSLGMTVTATWTYVPLGGKLACLEVSFEKEAASLHLNESVQMFHGFHTTTYLPFDQSDDYSFVPNQSAFADSKKITIYKDGVLVWGAPPT